MNCDKVYMPLPNWTSILVQGWSGDKMGG